MTTDTRTTSPPRPPNLLAADFLPAALLVLLCALGIRLLVLLQFRELNPLFAHPVIDAWRYDTMARDFLRLGSWPEPGAFFQPPAYPFFLAVVYKIFGESYTWAHLVQAFMGSFSCVFVYFIGRSLHSPRIGLTAGLITAFYGPLIFFDLNLLAPVLITFWSTLGLLLLILGSRQTKPLLLLAAGCCLGVAVAAWPIIGLACAVILLLTCWFSRRGLRRAAGHALLLILGIALPLLPSFLHNVSHGQWVLVSTNGGINFYVGNNPDWQETVAMRPGYPWEKIVTLPYRVYGPEQVEHLGNSNLFMQESLRFLRTQPKQYLSNQLVKLYHLLYGYEIMRNTDLYFFKRYSPVLDVLLFSHPWLKFPFGLLVAFAVPGIFLSMSRLGRENRFLLGYLIAVSAGLFLFFVTARYRVVLVPVMSLYAALGAWETAALLRQRSARGLLLLLATAILGMGANLDLFNQQQRVTSRIYRAQAPFTLGRVALEQGQTKAALEWLTESIRIDPSYPDAWIDMGRARHALGDTNGAVLAMRQAATVAPDYPLPYFNLGLIYDRPDLPPDQAIAYYQQFLAKAEAYFDERIRGPARTTQVRQRLTVLQAQENQP